VVLWRRVRLFLKCVKNNIFASRYLAFVGFGAEVVSEVCSLTADRIQYPNVTSFQSAFWVRAVLVIKRRNRSNQPGFPTNKERFSDERGLQVGIDQPKTTACQKQRNFRNALSVTKSK
jgi:hypothetical protein